MQDRGHLLTEQRNPASSELDALSTADAFDVMNREDRRIADAVASAKPEILAAIDLIVAALGGGGRLFYFGAGTSGRLGVLDAAECPPTFLTDPQLLQGVIAGGDAALRRAVEHAEDDADAGAQAVVARGVAARDLALGISAGGTTPFVHGALRAARERGAKSIFLACVPREQAADDADVSIRVLAGPEVLAGSTRLKAGIATKMVLNLLSTLTMVRLGKVFGNLMVDVNARGCAKLADRAIRTLSAVCGLSRETSRALLERADWHVKTAIVMQRLGLDAEQARRRLSDCGGHVRRVLEAAERGSCA
ncbi:MAG: N-acetylmuramic acid 6-phosphate etherase [Phycisphaerae bacterium]